MKITTIVNLATFSITAFVIGSSILGIAVSESELIASVKHNLHKARTNQISLANETMAFVNSQSSSQDTLVKRSRTLSEANDDLRDSLEKVSAYQNELIHSSRLAIAASESAIRQVDRIRAQDAVLSNVKVTLPKLLRSLRNEVGGDGSVEYEITQFAEIFAILARTPSDKADKELTDFRGSLQALLSADREPEIRRQIKLAIAQIDKVLAYRRFQRDEFERYLEDRDAHVTASAIAVAQESMWNATQEHQRHLRDLTVASLALVAFGCAGLWQFRIQSKRLRALNEELESRVETRTRELEKARRQSEAQLNALDRIQGRVEFNLSGHITDVNENYLHTTGYAAKEVVGQHHYIFVSKEERHTPRYQRFWDRLRSGDYLIGEYERIAKDGTSRWIRATYSPVLNVSGQVEKIVKYATDVTEQRAIEEKAKVAHQRVADLANVIRESPNEVFICDADTFQFVEVNEGAVEASGFTAEELAIMTPLDLNPEVNDEESLRKLVSPLVTGEKKVLEFPTTHRRKSGEDYPVQISLHRTVFHGKDVYVAFVTDLSEMRRLEDKLALAQKLESIGQMSAGIAHEINTPMQFVGDNIEYLNDCSDRLFKVVDGYHSMLSDDSAPSNWNDRRDAMQKLTRDCRFDRIREQMPLAIEESREGVRRTVKIVQAMKDFSHPGTKEKSPCSLNDLIESTVAISQNRWKYSAELKMDLDQNLPAIPMLASEINQVLLNLIVNAGDAIADRYDSESGELGTISVRTRALDEWITVEIQDNGCGMPESIKQKIFDPFFTTKEVGRGTGQGLAIAHGVVVKQHEGEFIVESEEGVGTTFTVKLPRCAESADIEISAQSDLEELVVQP